MHVLWINEHAGFAGVGERYIHETASLLRKQGIVSSLFFEDTGAAEPFYADPFEAGVYPLGELGTRLGTLVPDLLFVHRCENVHLPPLIAESGIPSVRFFHDHRSLCPRGDRMTAIGRQPCDRPVGWGCYSCLTFPFRGQGENGRVPLTSPGQLRRTRRANAAVYSAFLTGSHYMADLLALHGFDPSRIHVLPLYVPPPMRTLYLRRVERQPDLLLFVGPLIEGRGADLLLQAVSRMQTRPRLLIHGQGPESKNLKELAEAVGLEKRTVFAGKASGETLARAYLQATVAVLPARSPDPFFVEGPEAMSYGTPVVASAVGGVTEWLQDGVTGLAVPPNDPFALGRALDRLLLDETLRQRLSITGPLFVGAHFTADRHIASLCALFRQLTGSVTEPSVALKERIAA
ncbi:MAG: glycosyltransferase family 4 protein [Capsulimonadales bacterium]|nr:glycosyltransferase family 4 protein [Capsulimonadales bacterium]